MVFNTEIIKTHSEWAKNLKQIIDERIATNPNVLESHFAVLSWDKVLEVNAGDFTIMTKDSIVHGPIAMVITLVWIKKNGDWKIQYFHESTGKKSE